MTHSLLNVACVGVVTAAVCLATVVAQPAPMSQEDAKKLKNPVEATSESIAAGRVTYVKFCASCHGTAGKGDGRGAPEGAKPANLVDDKWDHGSTDGEIYLTIRDGVPPELAMEPWGERVTDTDIWNVINYIRSIGPKQTP